MRDSLLMEWVDDSERLNNAGVPSGSQPWNEPLAAHKEMITVRSKFYESKEHPAETSLQVKCTRIPNDPDLYDQTYNGKSLLSGAWSMSYSQS